MTSPLGLESGVVRLVAYDPAWPELFELEASRIAAAIAPFTLDLRHVGSTAIPGLIAKPVLDLLGGYQPTEDLAVMITRLEQAGYLHRGDQGIAGREFFRRGQPRAYHLHVTAIGSCFWRDQLDFCGLLLSDSNARERYSALKHALATRYPDDREAYIEGKGPFVREALRQWRSL